MDAGERYTEVHASSSWRVPNWVVALVLLYLLAGASGGIWYGFDRILGP